MRGWESGCKTEKRSYRVYDYADGDLAFYTSTDNNDLNNVFGIPAGVISDYATNGVLFKFYYDGVLYTLSPTVIDSTFIKGTVSPSWTALGSAGSYIIEVMFFLRNSEKLLIPSKELLQCDIIGDPANYPQKWIDNGIAGTPLLVGEEGEDYIPDGTGKIIKLSKKMSGDQLLLGLFSDDYGNTWNIRITSSFVSTTTNSAIVQSYPTGRLELWFYLTKASPFETAVNAEVLSLGDVWASNYNGTDYGARVIADLVNKIPISEDGRQVHIIPIKNYAITPQTENLINSGYYPVLHDTINLPSIQISPAAKTLPYLTRKNGKLYLQTLFKEMKYDSGSNADNILSYVSNTDRDWTKGDLISSLDLDGILIFTGVDQYRAYDFSNKVWGSDGLLYSTVGVPAYHDDFKLWDCNGWGDDSKFDIVDDVNTTIDDNGNTVLIGQKHLELPYFIGDGE